MAWPKTSRCFSRITGNISVNAGKAGKDIFGCVKTIDCFREFAKNGLKNHQILL